MLLLVSGVEIATSFGRVHPGVTVAGVDIGGKTPTAAADTLKQQLPRLVAVPVTVSDGAHSWPVKASDVGLSFDCDKLVVRAMAVGRSGGPIGSLDQRWSSWFGGESLPASPSAEPAKLDAAMSKITGVVDVPARDAAVQLSGTTVQAKRSAAGSAVDRSRLAADLLAAFTSQNRIVPVHATILPARVTDASAQRARLVVETMIAQPVRITHGSASWTLSPVQVAKMIAVRAVEASGAVGWR
ncbi:MAG: peptidoglycan binding domain-containing protein, partial [Coriobacteriia bacterium]|nr:peptidoglycan binding domain-containing protein [Coriobacteriia bacterium]